jgi:hypothetical protein
MFDEIKCHEFLTKAQDLDITEASTLLMNMGVCTYGHSATMALLEMVLQLNDRLSFMERKARAHEKPLL